MQLSRAFLTACHLAKALMTAFINKISTATIQRRLWERNVKKHAQTMKPFVSAANHWRMLILLGKKIGKGFMVCPITSMFKPVSMLGVPPRQGFSLMVTTVISYHTKAMVWGCFSGLGQGVTCNIKQILRKGQYTQILIHQMRLSAWGTRGWPFCSTWQWA